jgi:putative endonuclease
LPGAGYERKAERFLRSRGLRTIERNYRCRGGEIDLIMRDGRTVVFVEVRYRRSTAYGTPGETVSQCKQRRLLHAARHYLAKHAAIGGDPCRFDVIGISGEGEATRLNWIKNAFSA